MLNIFKIIVILCFFAAAMPQTAAYPASEEKFEAELAFGFFVYAFEAMLTMVPVKEYINNGGFIDTDRDKVQIEIYHNLTRFSPSPEVREMFGKNDKNKDEDKKTIENSLMEKYKKAYPGSGLWEKTEGKVNVKLDPALLEIMMVEAISGMFPPQTTGKDEASKKKLTDTFRDGTSPGRVKDLKDQIFVSGFYDDKGDLPLAVVRLSVKDEKGVFKGKKLLLLERTDGIWRISK